MTVERIIVANARGESYPDVLRRTGAFGVQPADNDTQAISRVNADALASAATAEAAAGPTYTTDAAGIAATPSGKAYALDNGDGTVTVKLNSGGTAVPQRTLATPAYLARPEASGGFGFKQGGTGATAETIQIALRRIVWIEQFGGAADYNPSTHTWTTDNVAALNRAKAALGASGGVVLFQAGNYYFGSDIATGNSVTLEGRCRSVGHQLPYEMIWLGSNLWHPASANFYMENSSALRFLNVFRAGLNFNQNSASVAAWTGNGLVWKENTTDHLLEDVAIIGFAWAGRPAATPPNYDGSPGSATYSRFCTKGQISIDCLGGLWLHNCSDLPRLNNVHCWPFATIFSPAEANSAQLKRPGWAIYLSGLNDHTMLSFCFNYGFTKSFHVDGGDNTTWLNCDADYPYQSGTDSSFGFQSSGGAQETRWIACQAVQRDSGFITNSTEPNLLSTEAIGCQAWECRTNGHAITKGHAKINGGITRSSFPGSVGIQTANDASVACEFAMHHFANLAHATVNGDRPIPLRDCGGNTYSNMPANTLHLNRYEPSITVSPSISLNGTDLAFVLAGAGSCVTIVAENDYVGKVVSFWVKDGMTFQIGGNVHTKTGSDTGFTAGSVVSFLATSTGWRQL